MNIYEYMNRQKKRSTNAWFFIQISWCEWDTYAATEKKKKVQDKNDNFLLSKLKWPFPQFSNL